MKLYQNVSLLGIYDIIQDADEIRMKMLLEAIVT